MGRRETKKDQKRIALIEAGMQLFTDQSFAKTTIDQITAKADVAKGTFYNYFTTKEDLLVAGMMIAQAESAEAVRPEVFALPTTHERLRRIVRWAVSWIAEHPELSVIWCLERLRRGRAQEGPSGFDQILLDVIIAGQTGGELRSDRAPQHMSLEITGMFVTYIFVWYSSGLRFDLAQAVEGAVDTYLPGAMRVR